MPLDDARCESDEDELDEENAAAAIDGKAAQTSDDIIALLAATSGTTSATPTRSGGGVKSAKPTLTLAEQRRQRAEERLKRLVARSGAALDSIELQVLANRVQSGKSAERDATVEIGGKKFAKLYKNK